jgi:Domain of unknown function (DUF4430)
VRLARVAEPGVYPRQVYCHLLLEVYGASINRPFLIVAATLLAAAVVGCGLSTRKGPTDVHLTITGDFGGRLVGAVTQRKPPGGETVMQLVERSFKVTARDDGGSVASINGLSGSGTQAWFFYVNGIEASKGAARTAVHPGDRIWWDLHDQSATDTVPAVVGSFPEPFVHGAGGRRLPSVLDCAPDVGAACRTAGAALRHAGVPVADQLLGGGSGSDSLAVVVGTWRDLHGVIAAELIDAGTQRSGVYARFADRGSRLQLLDAHGAVARTLGTGAGLIAATEQKSLSQPTWLITGTDPAGVRAAAAAFSEDRLRDHFALAVAGGAELAVPVS